MASKPMSWAMTALLFAWMAAVTIGMTLAFNGAMRHQAASIHSDFWQIAFPSDLVASAILAFAMRLAYNRILTSRCQTRSESHSI
jgi:membrane protein implicated in regulation of membrane protease activity